MEEFGYGGLDQEEDDTDSDEDDSDSDNEDNVIDNDLGPEDGEDENEETLEGSYQINIRLPTSLQGNTIPVHDYKACTSPVFYCKSTAISYLANISHMQPSCIPHSPLGRYPTLLTNRKVWPVAQSACGVFWMLYLSILNAKEDERPDREAASILFIASMKLAPALWTAR
ncbi:hypothetical protein BDR05DRAFT_944329 [Suillus weaverae]|nr:hypothetical protein BDR05DRAFT_944329 [Suillus weaverae]